MNLTGSSAFAVELRAKLTRIAELEAQNQRLHDLVRYKRHELFDDGLITDDEFSELVQDHSAVARLEGYDKAVANVKARLQEVEEVARELLNLSIGRIRGQAAIDLVQRATALLGPEKSAEGEG